ncbi:MAG: hypothetical protein QOK00_3205 [Thermoleophilaceae bacterium]|jgi:hypothetical protein|nr:hypothetical protein [Thermoleophilaceae bacterium]
MIGSQCRFVPAGKVDTLRRPAAGAGRAPAIYWGKTRAHPITN